MVTTLMRKSFDRLLAKRSPKDLSDEALVDVSNDGRLMAKSEDSARDSARLTIQVLAPMWMSFIFGAVTGAVIISSFHRIGLLGIGLLLIGLIFAEVKTKLPA
jgi:uncharacterized membrane protein YoaK (UPF0700 family)